MDAIAYQSRHIPKGQVQLATTVIIVYDHLTTFDREIELIWAKKWSLAQIFFIINRYLGDAVYMYVKTIGTSPTIQNVTFIWACFQTWGLNIVLWSMQAIMQHRIASIYSNSRKVIYTMATVYFLEIITMSTILGKALSTVHVTDEVIPGLFTIKVAGFPPWYYTMWIPPIFMEATIFGFALYAGYTYSRDSLKLDLETASKSGRRSLTFILLRDSIFFPFIALLAYTLSVGGWKGFPNPGGQTTVSVAGVVACVLGPRLMLNLREAYYRPFTEEAQGQLSAGLEFNHDDTGVSGVSGLSGASAIEHNVNALEGDERKQLGGL
ncbi:hypothetical protein BDZ94DRAFT_1249888 [Collybia nuda]|uniref:DUF6533 domain-containing protein n=1 Tax=Collybia nuda TaxID=64659 RepID=A0A9P5YGH2_9AGAR|nr:hypothetical protein BDZ94DRAFT_1249888 [Collybia nuda]